ncbi:ABC transporter substrate-binding protein [Pseudomonas monteilii]|jgi:dipeptide transport system substrate-binding protein
MHLRPLAGCLLGLTLLIHASTSQARTLVFCSEGSPAGFDTAQHTTATDNDAAQPIYNRLVEFERGGTAVEPALARRWEVSPDGLRYTFHLRDDVHWHTTPYFTPSRPFDADDVLFTFERMRDRQHPFRQAYPTEFPYFVSMGLDRNIARVEKTGPHTVVFTLAQVDAAFLQNLAMSFASILSAEYADQLLRTGRPSDLNHKPIGTGPFVFQRYQKDAQVRYVANPRYWKAGQGNVDKLVFSINVDPAVRLQKLKRNECQVTLNPRPADLPSLEQTPGVTVMTAPGFNLGFLAYNTQRAPFDQVQVRQALDMAVNKQAIIDAVFQEAGQVAVNAMPPTQWSYDASLQDAPYDPDRAKVLLEQAGITPDREFTLWAMPVQRPYNPNARLMAEMLQADWAKVGLKVRIVSYEWGEYVKRLKNGEHDIALIGWTGDNGDPDNWLGTLFGCAAVGGNNYARWCDAEYDALITQARSVTERTQRTPLYQQAQRLLKQHVPITPIAHSTVHQPLSTRVKGFKVSPFGRNDFFAVDLE